MKKILTLAIGMIAGAMMFTTYAQAASATGTWKRPSTGATYKVTSCGGSGLKLRVIKHPKAKWNGKTISNCAKKSGGNKWKGTITSTDDGKQYSGSMTLRGSNKLHLEGCALAGLICKGETLSLIHI